MSREGPWLVGGEASASADGGEPEAEPDAFDTTEAGPWVPAVPSSVPQVQTGAGPVLSAPVLQSITFAGYDQTVDADAVVASIGATDFFRQAVAWYGVGAATAVPPAHLASSAPKTIDDTGIKSWLVAQIAAGAVMPAAPQALYVVFYPSTTSVTLQGAQSCWQFGGYHDSVVADGVTVAYAVVPECSFGDWTALQTTTSSASHEIAGSWRRTPLSTSTSAWSGLDAAHVFWQILLGGEIADLCAQWADAFYTPLGYPYLVQRPWSNAAALAGRDPCKPELVNEVYFNSVPVLSDMVHIIDGAGATHVTGGVSVALGQSRTVDVQLYSDGPAAPWTVTAVNPITFPDELVLSWDHVTGQSGDTLHLTITVQAVNSDWGGEPFVVESTLGSATHYWLGFVGQ